MQGSPAPETPLALAIPVETSRMSGEQHALNLITYNVTMKIKEMPVKLLQYILCWGFLGPSILTRMKTHNFLSLPLRHRTTAAIFNY